MEKHKRWPKEKFLELLIDLKGEYNIDKIYIFASRDEDYIIEYLIKHRNNFEICVFNKNIVDSLHALTHCKFLIANDNGMVHAAHCLGIDHITIIGPSFPNQFVNKKLNNFISLNLPCSPCYSKQRFGCGDEICLKKLSSKIVKEKFDEINKKNNFF